MKRHSALFIALTCLLNSAAMAALDDGLTRLDKVEVKGFPIRYQADNPTSAMKTETPLKDTPQALNVVTQQQIEDQALHGMADVVRYVPGVGMAQGEGHRDAPVMRGNTSTGDFYTDGIRDDVQYYRDLYNVTQVEILKGPNAMIFGRGGSGGVINRVSKQADGNETRALSLQAGSHDFYRVQADLGDALDDNVAYRINAMAENAGSFRDGVNHALRGISPSFAFGLGDNTRMVLSAEYFDDSRTVDRGIPSFQGKPLNTVNSRFFGDAKASSADTEVASFDALIEHDFGGAVLRNRSRAANYDKFYQNVFPGAVDSAGTQVSLSAYNTQTDRKNLFNQTDFIFDVTQGNLTHRLLIGAELGRQDTGNFRETGYFGAPGSTVTSQTVSVDNPQPTLPINFRQSASDADNQGVADIAALYVQDQMHIGKNGRSSPACVMTASRWISRNNRNGVRTEQTDNMLSPRAGLIYQATPDFNLYASYSKAFVPRAGDQLASLTPSNANLNPEEFINHEIGIKWQLSRGLFSSLALYRLERGNVAVADPDNVGQSLLIDAQRSQGLEWDIGGNLSKTVQLLAGYAYQDAELTETVSASALKGAQLPLVPEHSAFVWGRWDISQKFGLGMGLNGQSAVYTSTSNAVRLPGFARWDAALYYTQSDNLKWQLNIENISDRQYFSSAHNDNNISVGTPREFTLSAHLDF